MADEATVDDIGERDCCPLVWKKLIDTPNGKLIPPDAIEIGAWHREKRYYSMLPGKYFNSVSNKIGIITEDMHKEVGYFSDTSENIMLYKEGCLRYSNKDTCESVPQDPILVLTNPYGCSIEWYKREAKEAGLALFLNPLESSNIHVPRIGLYYFSRIKHADDIKEHFAGSTEGGSIIIPSKQNMRHDPFDPRTYLAALTFTGFEILTINCRESIKNVMNAQLFNITYDSSAIPPEKESTTLTSSAVINNNPYPQSFEVSMSAQTTKSFQMMTNEWSTNKTEHHLSKSMNTEASIEAGFSFLGFGTKLKGSLKSGHEEKWDEMMQKYAQEGKVFAETKKTEYHFNQKVAVPPKSSTIVKIITTPIKGNIPFKAKYRIRSPKKDMFTMNQTLNALKRIGLEDVEKLVQEGDDLVMTYDGTLAVETGYDTHVTITSTPLEPNSTRPVVTEKLYPFDH